MTTPSRNCHRDLCRQLTPGLAAGLLLAVFLVSPDEPAAQSQIAPARSTVQQNRSRRARPGTPPVRSEDELEQQIDAVHLAKESGDLAAVTLHSKLLLGIGLRKMAELRMLETAFSQAAELYRQSLAFVDAGETHLDLAIAYLYGDRPDDALSEAGKALAADPGSAESWNAQGEALLKKKDYSRAADSLVKAFAMYPDLESAYALGICYLHLRESEKADGMFRQIKAAMGDSAAYHMLLAQAYGDARLVDEAKREYRSALTLNPKLANAHYMIGLIDLHRNEWAPTASSREEFLKELQFHPQSFSANYMLGFMASNAKNREESDHYLKVAAQLNPASVETWIYLGLNAYSGKENARAEEFFRRAITLAEKQDLRAHDEVRKAYLNLGRILMTSGRKPEGERFVEKARELEQMIAAESQGGTEGVSDSAGAGGASGSAPARNTEVLTIAGAMRGNATAPVESAALSRAHFSPAQKKLAETQEQSLRSILGAGFNDLATSEAMQEQYREALSHYQQAEQWDPKLPQLLRNLGFAAFRAGDGSEAVRALAKDLAASPKESTTRSVLGLAYFATQDYADAARTLAPLGESAKKDPDLGYAWAASLARTGDAKHAAEILQTLESGSVPAETLVLTGRLWNALGNSTAAVGSLQRALELSPSLPTAHQQLGKVLLGAGDAKAAIPHLEEAARLNPEVVETHCDLSDAYRQDGRAAEADRELQVCREPKTGRPQPPPEQKDQHP